MDISAFLVICIQLLLLVLALMNIFKKPFDIGTIMVLLYMIFYALPAWDFYFQGDLFLKTIQNYPVGYENDNEGLYLIFVSTLIILAFYIGYLLIGKLFCKESKIKYTYKIDYKKYKLVISGLLTLWFAIFLYSFSNYDQSLLLFFSPSRKEGVFESGYIGTLYLLIPLSLFIIKALKDYINLGKIKVNTLLLVLPVIAIYMTSGQRREILNLLIFLMALLTHLGVEKLQKRKKINSTKYKRKKIIQLGVLSVILIPVLWWGRVVFTQLQRNSTDIIMPWNRRGFLELLFGSSSGGFKTLLLGLEHKEFYEIEWGHSIYFFISSIIPRSLMENKPILMNIMWQRDFGLQGNPSTFYINEMYLNFGLLSILISAVFGIVLSFFYNKFYNSKSIVKNVFAYLIFSEVILLYKNGFTQFMISILITLSVVGVICKMIFRKGKVKV